MMICFASVVAFIVTAYVVYTGKQELSVIQTKDYIANTIGSILVMFIPNSSFFSACASPT